MSGRQGTETPRAKERSFPGRPKKSHFSTPLTQSASLRLRGQAPRCVPPLPGSRGLLESTLWRLRGPLPAGLSAACRFSRRSAGMARRIHRASGGPPGLAPRPACLTCSADRVYWYRSTYLCVNPHPERPMVAPRPTTPAQVPHGRSLRPLSDGAGLHAVPGALQPGVSSRRHVTPVDPSHAPEYPGIVEAGVGASP